MGPHIAIFLINVTEFLFSFLVFLAFPFHFSFYVINFILMYLIWEFT